MEETPPIVNPNIPPEIQIKPTKPWLKIALFAGFGLILVGGLVFACYQLGKTKTQSTSQLFPTPSPTIIPTKPMPPTPTLKPALTIVPDETANWKTYKNENILFEFKYPAKAKLEELKSSTQPLPDIFRVLYYGPSQGMETEFYDGYEFSIRVVDGMNADPNAVDIVSQNAYQNDKNNCPPTAIFGSISTTIINGNPAKTYTVTNCWGDYSEYYIKRGKTVFRITQFWVGNSPDKENYKKIIDQIFSTVNLHF